MNNNMEMIELENGLKLIIMDEIEYENRNFVRVAKFNPEENDILEDTYIYERENDTLEEITDNYLLEMLISIFEQRK